MEICGELFDANSRGFEFWVDGHSFLDVFALQVDEPLLCSLCRGFEAIRLFGRRSDLHLGLDQTSLEVSPRRQGGLRAVPFSRRLRSQLILTTRLVGCLGPQVFQDSAESIVFRS